MAEKAFLTIEDLKFECAFVSPMQLKRTAGRWADICASVKKNVEWLAIVKQHIHDGIKMYLPFEVTVKELVREYEKIETMIEEVGLTFEQQLGANEYTRDAKYRQFIERVTCHE